MLSGHVSTQVQEGRDVILAHVGKLLPQACHLEAKQCGVVEVEQFPQREQDGRAVSALFQALNTWEQGFQRALGSHPTTEILDCLPSQ